MKFYLIEIQLFPCLDYFKKGIRNANWMIEQFENHKKKSFRNRYVISGANGLINLTIPLHGGREQRQLLKNIEIDYSNNWQIKHWRAIVSSYNKSPYFNFYKDVIKELIFHKEKSLLIYDMNALQWILSQLKLKIEISLTREYKNLYENTSDFRDTIIPKNYTESGENFQPKYAQVFEDRFGFLPNLSILDLLFAEGPNTCNLLAKSVK